MNYEQKHPILQKLEEYFKNTPKEQINKDWSGILKDTDSEAYYEKKYKSALERASKLRVQNPFDTVGQMVEHIFPELKEDNDEIIRKWLIDWANAVNWSEQFTITKEQVIAWLEKQGKALNPDKVIEWLEDQACLGWIEDVEVDKFIEQFKKYFEI